MHTLLERSRPDSQRRASNVQINKKCSNNLANFKEIDNILATPNALQVTWITREYFSDGINHDIFILHTKLEE